ncbi:MAG TPA: hypothetical protein VJJ98_03730 [Sedimentisphaerales bacterium]|nr:hypothetical protein [Sedimentisphaerales bacterium]
MVRGSCFVAKSLLRRIAQDVATAIETEATVVDSCFVASFQPS